MPLPQNPKHQDTQIARWRIAASPIRKLVTCLACRCRARALARHSEYVEYEAALMNAISWQWTVPLQASRGYTQRAPSGRPRGVPGTVDIVTQRRDMKARSLG